MVRNCAWHTGEKLPVPCCGARPAAMEPSSRARPPMYPPDGPSAEKVAGGALDALPAFAPDPKTVNAMRSSSI